MSIDSVILSKHLILCLPLLLLPSIFPSIKVFSKNSALRIRWRSIQLSKSRPGADCDSDHELLVAKCRLKLKKYRENKAIQVWPNSNTLLYTRKVKVTQLCSTLCDPMDYTVHGILQARILEWVAFSFSKGSSQPRDWIRVSCIAGRFFNVYAIREAPKPYPMRMGYGICRNQCNIVKQLSSN